jgi:hypothetical protein
MQLLIVEGENAIQFISCARSSFHLKHIALKPQQTAVSSKSTFAESTFPSKCFGFISGIQLLYGFAPLVALASDKPLRILSSSYPNPLFQH